MTREEHINWAKQRALEYLARGDIPNTISSMSSDLVKHPDTAPLAYPFATKAMQAELDAREKAGDATEAIRNFIEELG